MESHDAFPPLCPILCSPTQAFFDAISDRKERKWVWNEDGEKEFECSESESKVSIYSFLPSPSTVGSSGGIELQSPVTVSFPLSLNVIPPSLQYVSPSLDAASPTSAAASSPSQSHEVMAPHPCAMKSLTSPVAFPLPAVSPAKSAVSPSNPILGVDKAPQETPHNPTPPYPDSLASPKKTNGFVAFKGAIGHMEEKKEECCLLPW